MAPETSKASLGKVAKILSTSRVVINRGSTDGIKVGDKYIIYELGEEVQDPDTQESLGRLQVIKGRADVIGLQPKLAILEAVEYEYPKPDPFASLYPFLSKPEVKRTVKPFNDVKVGDFALKID